MTYNANDPATVHVVEPTADPATVPDIVIRPFTANGCTVTPVIIDPADAQYTLYGTVTRPDGTFVGSYYAADNVCGQHWRIVTIDGKQYHADSEPHAVATLVHTLAAR